MSGWLASNAVPCCSHAMGAEVEPRWLRIAPHLLARGMPAAGPMLYLPCAATPTTEATTGLLVGCRELAPLRYVRWLVAACMIGSDGPHEWLECRAGDGRLCARLHLLPDSDYLGWDTLLATGVPGYAMGRSWPHDERIASARLLAFRCRRLAGLDLLEAQRVAHVSALGGGIAHGIARAMGLSLGC